MFLAGFMLLSLVACGSTVDDPTVTGTKENETVTEQVTDDPNYICDLPSDLNYGGESIGILYINLFEKGAELVSEELGLGVVSDAVFERNLLVEEQLGITYEYYPETIVTRVAEAQSLDIQSGLGDYDIVVNGTYLAVQPSLEGKYINLSDLEYIDTSKHYWTQGYSIASLIEEVAKIALNLLPAVTISCFDKIVSTTAFLCAISEGFIDFPSESGLK